MCMDREQESFVRPRARIGTYSYGKFTLESGWEFEEPAYAYSHDEIDRHFDACRRGAERCITDEEKRRLEITEIEESRAKARKELEESLSIHRNF